MLNIAHLFGSGSRPDNQPIRMKAPFISQWLTGELYQPSSHCGYGVHAFTTHIEGSLLHLLTTTRLLSRRTDASSLS